MGVGASFEAEKLGQELFFGGGVETFLELEKGSYDSLKWRVDTFGTEKFRKRQSGYPINFAFSLFKTGNPIEWCISY